MQASQTCEPLSSDTSAMARLHDFLRQRQAAQEPVEDLETFEQQLHALFVAAEREAMGEELARFDVDVPTIEVEGQRDHRVPAMCPDLLQRRWASPCGAHAVPGAPGRRTGAVSPGAVGRAHRRLLDTLGGQAGHVVGSPSDAAGKRGVFYHAGEHDALQK